jgi:hypothetical protein
VRWWPGFWPAWLVDHVGDSLSGKLLAMSARAPAISSDRRHAGLVSPQKSFRRASFTGDWERCPGRRCAKTGVNARIR